MKGEKWRGRETGLSTTFEVEEQRGGYNPLEMGGMKKNKGSCGEHNC